MDGAINLKSATMDKSVNNFDDVDDTMSSVYNAWRKNQNPKICRKKPSSM
jgi:hypothetical protein